MVGVIRRILVWSCAAACAAAAGFIASAPAEAIPQCRDGYVTGDCAGTCVRDDLPGVDQCSGPVASPLFPEGPPVRVGLEGGVGVGI